ncbi:MAG: hypothetical protein O2856_09705 [Planctomycetota bacterium]|nr:hypothetical protein [Planctomycetota bacterium]
MVTRSRDVATVTVKFLTNRSMQRNMAVTRSDGGDNAWTICRLLLKRGQDSAKQRGGRFF